MPTECRAPPSPLSRVPSRRNAHKVGRHFTTTTTDDGFSCHRDEEKIAAEAALDGICVIRTNVPATEIRPEDAVRAYKSLSRVERAFRGLSNFGLSLGAADRKGRQPVFAPDLENARGRGSPPFLSDARACGRAGPPA